METSTIAECKALQNKGDHQQAIEKLAVLADENPKDANVWYLWGLSLVKLRQYQRAQEKFAKAISLDPKNDDAKRYSELIAGALKDPQKEVEKEVEKLPPMMRFPPHRPLMQQLLGMFLYNKGISLKGLEDWDGAIDCFSESVECAQIPDNPDDSWTWIYWGETLRELGKGEDAIEKIAKGITLDSSNAAGWTQMGITLASLGRHQDAVGRFARATKLDKDQFLAWEHWGICLLKLKDYKEAQKKLDRAVEINKTRSSAWYYRACAKSVRGDAKGASKDLERAISLDDKWRGLPLEDPHFISSNENESS
ncbi:MAG: tetratricopeptide repeat protein [Candidatus Hodarchaeales archaeon]